MKRFLVISMETDDSAPGIVFKNLLVSMARSSKVTVICPSVDVSFLGGAVEILPISFHQHSWHTLERRWHLLGFNPGDWFFLRKVIRKYGNLLSSRRFDAVITLTSNGYYSALDLSKALSSKLGIGWAIYSVDALPCPLPWFEGHQSTHRHLCSHIRSVCAGASLVISSNELMMAYQRSILGDVFKGRIDFLYTPIPILKNRFVPVPHKGLNILYAGSIYGLRRIDGLLAGFSRFLSVRQDAHIIFVGDVWKCYREQCHDLEKSGHIEFYPYTKDIVSWYSISDILLDIAADIPDDVFLSSKIISYLPIPCPIIAISGANSPSRRILSGCGSIIHCSNDADSVFDALVAVAHYGKVSDREELVEKFSSDVLAESFISKINTI